MTSALSPIDVARPDGWRPPLHERCRDALASGDEASLRTISLGPHDERDEHDELLTLLSLLDLHLAPLHELGPRARLQHHPEVARLKTSLEQRYLHRLRRRTGSTVACLDGAEAVRQVRAIAAADVVPPVYEWLAERATLDEVRHFLALEGGPDGGFDDFVALAQVGLHGEPKLELAQNYWDEMGRGDPGAVHTELHRRMAHAVGMAPADIEGQPVEALARAALGPVLATNRWLQPELIGALGLLELQAGPRSRKVVSALQRLDAPAESLTFYEEHARTDPRHGKDWLDHVVAPLARDHRWAGGIVRGARWRSTVNDRFFTAVAALFGASG